MKTKEIIRQIAKQHGVTPEQVEADMKEAIRVGMASTDPHAQKLWKQIAPDGKEPSIETFLNYCVGELHKRTGC